MKKLLSVLIVLSLVCALFVLPASASENVVNIKFEGENVKVRDGADLAVLRDGKKLSEVDAKAGNFDKPGIVLIQNTNAVELTDNTQATLYFELDSEQDIDSVYITWFVYHMAMIGLPHNNNLIIGVSTNGDIYNEIGAYDFEGETDPDSSFQLDLKIRLGQTVKAKYVSVAFEFGPNGQDGWDKAMWEWVGFTEVGAGLQANEVEEVPDDVEPLSEKFDIFEQCNDLWVKTPVNDVDINIETADGVTVVGGSVEGAYPWADAALAESIVIGEGTYLVYDLTFDVGSTSLRLNDKAVHQLFDGAQIQSGSDDLLPGTYKGGVSYEDLAELLGTTEDGYVVISKITVFSVGGAEITFNAYEFDPSYVPEEKPDESSEDPSEAPSEDPSEGESVPVEDDKSEDVSKPVAGDKKDDEGSNTGLIIGIAIGVVAVVAVVVVVIILKKKK